MQESQRKSHIRSSQNGNSRGQSDLSRKEAGSGCWIRGMAEGGSDSEVDCIYLGQWFVTRGDFALQQTFSNIWRHFGDMLLLAISGDRLGICYWHQVSGGQGC